VAHNIRRRGNHFDTYNRSRSPNAFCTENCSQYSDLSTCYAETGILQHLNLPDISSIILNLVHFFNNTEVAGDFIASTSTTILSLARPRPVFVSMYQPLLPNAYHRKISFLERLYIQFCAAFEITASLCEEGASRKTIILLASLLKQLTYQIN